MGLLNDKELINNIKFMCDVDENALKKTFESKIQHSIAGNNTVCTSAKIYIEADKAIFTAQGSDITTAANFVNTLFGQVAVIYDNEGVFIQISQLKIWNTNDPYISSPTTVSMLNAFTNQVGSAFVGDIAQLLSGRLGGGTANAYLDICSKGLAVSAGMSNTIDNVPIYSQNVLVFAHEMGHSFGSPHTHSCSWANGAIDNCGPMAGYNEGCTGPVPTYGGGTIMSYCHLVGSVGINFINGFGTLPGNLVRDRTSICVSGLGTAPTNLMVKEAYNTSVLLGWDVSGGKYTLQYKPTSSSVWSTIIVTTNYCRIFDLIPNTNYNWQVKASCSAYTVSTFGTNNIPTPEPTYCNISYTNSCNAYGIGISDVILNSVNFNPSSGCGSNSSYSLISNPVRNLLISQTYSLTINQLWIGAGSNPVQATVWIDFNKNGEFEYSANPALNERVFTTINSYTLTGIIGTFTIPSGLVTKNNTRMRVILNYINNPQSPCGTYQYGETEDFVVNIINNSSPCLQNVILISNAVPTQNISSGIVTLQASTINGVINASNFITGIGTKAIYQAKNISLTNGFRADKGAIFKAEVGGCN